MCELYSENREVIKYYVVKAMSFCELRFIYINVIRFIASVSCTVCCDNYKILEVHVCKYMCVLCCVCE